MFKLVVTCSGFAATEQDFIQNQETFDLSCATEIEDCEEYPNEENHYTGIQTFTLSDKAELLALLEKMKSSMHGVYSPECWGLYQGNNVLLTEDENIDDIQNWVSENIK